MILSCAAPQFSTVQPERLKLGPDARIVSVDFATGERFLFDYDGARLVRADSVVFGKTDGGSFISIPLKTVRSMDSDSTGIRTVRTNDGLTLALQWARIYRQSQLITGRTINGETVSLPLGEADKVNVLNNYARIRNDDEAREGFTFLGIIAATVGYVYLKLKYGSR